MRSAILQAARAGLDQDTAAACLAPVIPRVWTPNKGPQAAFIACPLAEVLFGGSAGGGKSDALLMDALGQIHLPTYRAILFRRSYPELEELLSRAHELYPAHGGVWKDKSKTWRFPGGATIKFRYVSRDADVLRYQGHSYGWIGWDELTHFTLFQYTYMFSRNRCSDPRVKLYVRASCNPGGPGHGWVRARFIDAALPMAIISETRIHPISGEARTVERTFIPSRLADNPYLAATDYALNLLQLSEADQRALLLGDWDAYEGEVFKLVKGTHILTWAEFREYTGLPEIPQEWTRFTALDWGYSKPFSIGWYAMDYEGRLYKYREWYGCAVDDKGAVRPDVGLQLLPRDVAERMLEWERDAGETIESRIADPSIKQKWRGDQLVVGPTIQEQFNDAGIDWTLGLNDRLAGKMQVHKRLAIEEDGFPGLILIAEECPGSIRTIPALQYDPNRGGEDVDSTSEDHAYDETRYAVMSRPYEPRLPDPRSEFLKARDASTDWRAS